MRAKLKTMLKNQKGMTLIELLAVIVILGIIAAIAIPSVSGIINKTKNDADISNGLMVINAAKIAVADQDSNILSKVNGGTPVTLEDLNKYGYLDDIPTDPHDKTKTYSNTKSVITISHAQNTESYTYSIKLVSNDSGKTTRLDDVSETDLNAGKTKK
jgi:type IV pilus assembly protein PilA